MLDAISDPLGPFRAPGQPLCKKNNADFGRRFGFGSEQIQNFKNRSLSRGNTPLDVTHNFTTDLVYKLASLGSSSGFIKNVFGGWTASEIFKASTGLSFDTITGKNNGDCRNIQSPNRVPGVPLTLPGVSPADGFLLVAAFTVPTAVDPKTGQVLGNGGNNEVRMPPAHL